MNMRSVAAVNVAKILTLTTRALGRGGSTFPGRVALKVAPRFVARMTHQLQGPRIVISGTNGKTTTANMLSAIMHRAGLTPVHNRTGSNLMYGIAAALAHHASPVGRLNARSAIFEVDEATTVRATREIQPHLVLVTNFFRDQLDRFGELDRTVALVKQSLACEPRWVVLNCDDPLVVRLAEGISADRLLFYGLEDESCGTTACAGDAREGRYCSRCGCAFVYDLYYYGQMGHYSCPACGFARPRPDIAVVSVNPRGIDGGEARLKLGERLSTRAGLASLVLQVPLPGLYNIYNAAAAASAALAAGIETEHITRGIDGFASCFGRMEAFTVEGRRLVLALVKNPTGFNEVLRTVLSGPGSKALVLAINDNFADGTDISWLWDVDFESLGEAGDVRSVIASGLRATDMALRMKYAGLSPDRLALVGDMDQALYRGLEALPEGGTLFVLPTYTAMLAIRRGLERRGIARPFWRRR